MQRRFDPMTPVVFFLIFFMIYQVIKDRSGTDYAMAAGEGPGVDLQSSGGQNLEESSATLEKSASLGPAFSPQEMEAIAAPYTEYVITQRVHGASYGHSAIDIAAGKGAAILSPINGFVTERYVDQYGNPTLIIENDVYRVTMLHGKYSVNVGDRLNIGQQVGKESNKGYTTDMQGRLCANRNCGYHTHLNIYDKSKGRNVNPLKLIQP
jgi:murein DD-endopeptidase MepM/ murein hydrolase activator NlpD